MSAISLRTAGPSAQEATSVLRLALQAFYKGLLLLSCLSMLGTLAAILLGIVARQIGWNIPGLDAYAGYSIAAALFLALPATLKDGDHIRVTLVLQHLGQKARRALELWGLGAALALSSYLAYFACRLVWVSHLTHDISTSSDATPLWIPQSAMALGCIGFAMAFADALCCHVARRPFFSEADTGEAAHVE